MRTVRIALLAAAVLALAAVPALAHAPVKERTPKAAGLKRGDKAILRAVFASSLPDGSYRGSRGGRWPTTAITRRGRGPSASADGHLT